MTTSRRTLLAARRDGHPAGRGTVRRGGPETTTSGPPPRCSPAPVPTSSRAAPRSTGSGALLYRRKSLLSGAGVLGGTPSVLPLLVGTVHGG
ncbi:hypothetical protein ABZX77_50155 [Streptomyces sp. NPDC004237]|uniref:hypothetical protein n=1 Tax=Streptomyces sp. NPDC004237 TaxID=3154455 RepID=UPI0033A44C71